MSRNVQDLELAITSAKAQGVTNLRESMTAAEQLLQEVRHSKHDRVRVCYATEVVLHP